MVATPEFARELLTRHGQCSSQSITDWSGPFELPKAICDFYAHVGPVDICIEGYGNPTTIPSLKRLWDSQAGYRWNGVTNKPIDDWPSNWLVIADEGADPYIYDSESTRILFAQHGTGSWDADEIYPDLNTMAACIATLGCIILDSDEFEDDDCNINPECRMEAINRLTAILGSSLDAEEIVVIAGRDLS